MFSEVVLYLSSWPAYVLAMFFINNESLKAVVCLCVRMGLHVTHVDSVLPGSQLTAQLHIKLIFHIAFLI